MRCVRAMVAAACAALIVSASAAGQQPGWKCLDCPEWNRAQAPFKVFGNTWYVGPHGLSVLLITSDQGHVLIDGALPESASGIAASIRALGFAVEDIRLIVTSHVHFDHAGAVSALQRLSKARVAATDWSRRVLENGGPAPDDPQLGLLLPMARVQNLETIKGGDVLRVGPIALTAHETPGHTPGGTSWTWRACERERCVDLVYADSISAVSADGYRYSDNPRWPTAVADFERTFETIARLPCDILITPHPDASGLWERLAKRTAGDGDALVDGAACRRYAEGGRARLRQRLERERQTGSTFQ